MCGLAAANPHTEVVSVSLARKGLGQINYYYCTGLAGMRGRWGRWRAKWGVLRCRGGLVMVETVIGLLPPPFITTTLTPTTLSVGVGVQVSFG